VPFPCSFAIIFSLSWICCAIFFDFEQVLNTSFSSEPLALHHLPSPAIIKQCSFALNLFGEHEKIASMVSFPCSFAFNFSLPWIHCHYSFTSH
jgi:hypothetical protein